jgi:hypothetical protein
MSNDSPKISPLERLRYALANTLEKHGDVRIPLGGLADLLEKFDEMVQDESKEIMTEAGDLRTKSEKPQIAS